MSFRKFLSIVLLALILLGSLPYPTVSAQANSEVISNAVAYLQGQQQPDGGFPGVSGTSDPSTTARAILAIYAIGQNPADFTTANGITPIDYLSTTIADYIFDPNEVLFPANAGLMLSALAKNGSAPSDLPGLLMDTMKEDGSFASEAVEEFSNGTNTGLSQAMAVLGLASTGDPIPTLAVTYLISLQLEDGTWDNGFGSDPDTTALAVVALLSSGQVKAGDPVIQKAFDYFKTTQLDNAGWRPSWDTDELNVDTTGWISLAIITAGEDLSNWSKGESDPTMAITSMQKEDGAIGGTYTNVYSTVEALLGFAQEPLFPFAPAPQTEQTLENQAALVVTLPDGTTVMRCVNYNTAEITGFELLQQSGLKLENIFDPGMGPAVCGIENQGCKSDNCFCEMPNFFSYWHWENDTWSFSQAGAGVYMVQPGALEGWSWGDTAPVEITYKAVCEEKQEMYVPVISGPVTESAVIEAEPAPTDKSQTVAIDPEEINSADPAQIYTPIIIFIAIVVGLSIVLMLVIRKRRQS
jgi:hypothetical protein